MTSFHLTTSRSRHVGITVSEVAKYEFGVITYGITSVPNFMYVLTNIIQLSNVHKWIPQLVRVTKCKKLKCGVLYFRQME
jgi:hypothetical protein